MKSIDFKSLLIGILRTALVMVLMGNHVPLIGKTKYTGHMVIEKMPTVKVTGSVRCKD